MGANQSTSMTEILNQASVDVFTKMSSSIQNNSKCGSTTVQSISLLNEGVLNCGTTLKLANTAESTVKCLANFSNNVDSNIANQVSTDLNNKIKELIEQANEGLNLGQFNSVDSQTKIENVINTNMSSIISNSIKNNFENFQTTDQNITFVNRGTINAGSCELTNEAITKIFAESFSDNVVKSVVDNVSDTSITSEIDKKISQKNVGLSFDLIMLGIIAACVIGVYLLLQKLLMLGIIIGIIIALGSLVYHGWNSSQDKKKYDEGETAVQTNYSTSYIIFGLVFVILVSAFVFIIFRSAWGACLAGAMVSVIIALIFMFLNDKAKKDYDNGKTKIKRSYNLEIIVFFSFAVILFLGFMGFLVNSLTTK